MTHTLSILQVFIDISRIRDLHVVELDREGAFAFVVFWKAIGGVLPEDTFWLVCENIY